MLGQPDAMDVYDSFFRGSDRHKSRTASRLIMTPRNPPTGYTVWVGEKSREDEAYWQSTDTLEMESITYSDRGWDKPNICHHSFSRSAGSSVGDLPSFTVRFLAGIPVADVVPEVTSTYACGAFRPRYTREIGWDPSARDKALGDAIASVASQGYRAMMNLPQAIIELKDVPRSISQLGQLMSWCRGVARSRNSARALKRLVRYGSLQQVARTYLNAVFGIMPTASDVSNFLKQIPKRLELSGRVVDYKKGQRIRAAFRLGGGGEIPIYAPTSVNGTYTKVGSRYRRWSYSLGLESLGASSSSVAAEGTTNTGDWPYGSHLAFRVSSLQGVAFGRVAETVDWNDAVNALDDILAQAPPALVLWELTPFSFVVDWFADVSGWMRRANRMRWASARGLRLEDGVWLGERSTSSTYYPKVTQSLTESYRRLWAAGEQIAYSCSGISVKTVSHSLVGQEGTYDRRGLGDLRIPTLDLRGVQAQGMFQAGTGLALCLG